MQGASKVLRDLAILKSKVKPFGRNNGGITENLDGLCVTVIDAMSEAYRHRVSLQRRMTNTGAVITASHPALGFIEFGTGILHNSGTEYGQKYGFTPASWSKDHEQWLTDPVKLAQGHGAWPLANNVWVEGEAPADAFGIAEKMIRELAMTFIMRGFE